MQPAPSPSYFKEVVVLLHENVQETEEGRGWEADHVVVVTFDFTYEKPTKTLSESSVIESKGLGRGYTGAYLYCKATSTVEPFARVDVGVKEAQRVVKKVDKRTFFE